MIEKRLSTADELRAETSKFKNGFLFRGQVNHYLTDNGATSLRSSFWVNGGPDGCVPPLRAAWMNFAHFTLYTLSGDYNLPPHQTEAILQHYGWKSFFLDVSKSPAVAAWFASNEYSEQMSICMTEGLHEQPLFLRGKSARFDRSQAGTEGHLYVISQKELTLHKLELMDLQSIKTAQRKSRPEVQQACLIGPTNSQPLPESLIAAHFIVPSEALATYAASDGYDAVESMFPTPVDDPIYAELLNGPWRKLQTPENRITIPAFTRLLEIPDYYWECPRRLTGRDVLFDGTSIEERSADGTGPFAEAHFVRIEEAVFFFSNHDPETQFSSLRQLLDQNRIVVFELPIVWKRPDLGEGADLSKGLVVQRLSENQICLMELTIDWRETELSGFGAETGYRYEFDPGLRLTRRKHDEDCPCNNEGRHQFHFEALCRIECFLQTETA